MTITTTQEKNRILLEQIRDALPAGGTLYWNSPGLNFVGWVQGNQANAIDYHFVNSSLESDQDTATFMCPVFLPHGAVVASAVVYGNINDEQWALVKANFDGDIDTIMAEANINTIDSTITQATIDNAGYFYYIYTSTLDDTDKIVGAKITYTL